MITICDVKKGYEDGAIQLIKSPHGDGTVCRIGENWFYFGGWDAEERSPGEYEKHVPKEDIIQKIYDTLDGMRTDRLTYGDEYEYYESCLEEASDAKIKVRTYKATGDADQNFFFGGIREALRKYVDVRDAIPGYKWRMSHWPTIWLRTDKGFRRVHDFAFWELTDGNIEKYLAERIIDGDELLDGITL